MTYKNGSIYDGQWKDDKRHGDGKMIYYNGYIYEGEFENDVRHGQGKYTWPS